MRIAHLICAAFLLALASCGGSSVAPLQVSSGPVPDSLINAGLRESLPAIPDAGRFQLPRMTAAIENEATLPGAQNEQDLRTTVNGASLDFNSEATGVAYSLYRFTGAPGEEIDLLRLTASALSTGGLLYAAMGNYSTGRWEFLAPTDQLVTEYNLPSPTADYTSPVSGSIFVLVAAYGGDTATLDSLTLSFPGRHSISGTVEDINGNGLPGVLVSTGIPGQSALTDANGDFAIYGLPDGAWALAATSHAYTFYSNPLTVTVAGSNVSNVLFIGNENGSNFVPRDPLGPNNTLSQAQPLDLPAGTHYDSLSALDDIEDNFVIDFPAPGKYLIEYDNPGHDIFTPILELRSSQFSTVAINSGAWSGRMYLGVTIGTPGPLVLHVRPTGGAGEYSLRMSQEDWAALEGTVDNGGMDLAGARTEVVEDAGAASTIYHMDPFAFIGSSWYDGFRRMTDCTITPQSPAYTYVPPVFNAALSGGDVTAAFTSTFVAVNDSYEPNDTQPDADANAVLTLPYNSVLAGDDLSFGEGDGIDIYRVEPALGLGMRVVVEFTNFGSSTAWSGNLQILDSASTAVAFGDIYDGRLVAELPMLADGNEYYLYLIATTPNRTADNYTLRVEPFMAQNLVLKADIDGVGLPGVRFEVRQDDFSVRHTLITDPNGETAPLLVPEGSEVFVEALRYGVEFDRQTQRSLVPNGALTLEFHSSEAGNLDSFEPNDDFTLAQSLPALPYSFTATLDQQTDSMDFYNLTLPSADPLHITLSTPVAGFDLIMVLFDENNIPLEFITLENGITRSLNPQGSGLRKLQFFGNSLPDSYYDLTLEQGPAFMLDGNVVDNAFLMPIPGSLIFCRELQELAYPDWGTGDYVFTGLLGPGTYTLDCWAAGYLLDSTTVTIINADETVNFELVFDPGSDNYEANDTDVTAEALPADGSLSLPCTVGPPDPDFFKFTGTLGAFYSVRLDWAEPWYMDANINNIESPTMGGMGGSFNFQLGYQEVVFEAPETGDYVFEVGTFGQGAEYQVRITEF